jgi:CMP-N-acetylneuraminic acid synthetase
MPSGGTLAIITARGGSKGLPGKNIRKLLGKPLIGWTVEAAKAARHVDKVVVSSDSEEILEVARQFGADTPLVRPAELAGDLAQQEDAVLHAMDQVEESDGKYDRVMLLAPANPLRDAQEIDAVAEAFMAHSRAEAMMTVIPCEHSPLQANVLPEDGSLKDFIPADIRWKNRQELPRYYRISGSVCLSQWDHFREHRSFMTPLTYAYVTSPRRGLDIDTLSDFLLAEAYLRNPGVN